MKTNDSKWQLGPATGGVFLMIAIIATTVHWLKTEQTYSAPQHQASQVQVQEYDLVPPSYAIPQGDEKPEKPPRKRRRGHHPPPPPPPPGIPPTVLFLIGGALGYLIGKKGHRPPPPPPPRHHDRALS